MNSLTRNITILWRSQQLITQAELRRTSTQITIMVLAGVFGLLALTMLNVAGFYWLSAALGDAQAALAVAVADILIGAMLVLAAQTLKTAPETEMVREFRDSALAEIEKQGDAVQAQLVQMRKDVEAIGTNLSNFASDPIGSLTPNLLVPAVQAFTKVVRSSKS